MALTGAFSGSTCYSSQSVAVDAYYAAIPPSLTAGATNYLLSYIKTVGASGVWQAQTAKISSLGVTTVTGTAVVVPPVFPVCDPMLGFQDGLAFALVVVGLIASASFYGIISRAK